MYHLKILLIDNQHPVKGPCFIIACFPYSEQVGENLHFGGNKGEITF